MPCNAQDVFVYLEAYRQPDEDLLTAADRFLVRTAVYGCDNRKAAQETLSIKVANKMHRRVHKWAPEKARA